MTPRTISPRRLQIGALLAPIVIAQGATFFLGAGPAAAPAATAPAPLLLEAVLAPPQEPAPTPQQRACLEFLASLPRGAAPLRSPMAHDLPPEPVLALDAETGPNEPAPPAPDPSAVPPDLRLTAILDNRSGGMAAVDGRIVRPGDELAPGWRLMRIDAADNRIIITNAEGRTAAIDLPRGPGL